MRLTNVLSYTLGSCYCAYVKYNNGPRVARDPPYKHCVLNHGCTIGAGHSDVFHSCIWYMNSESVPVIFLKFTYNHHHVSCIVRSCATVARGRCDWPRNTIMFIEIAGFMWYCCSCCDLRWGPSTPKLQNINLECEAVVVVTYYHSHRYRRRRPSALREFSSQTISRGFMAS